MTNVENSCCPPADLGPQSLCPNQFQQRVARCQSGTATLIASAVLGLVPLGWIARIILFALLERGAFRRRLMIIGAGQRA